MTMLEKVRSRWADIDLSGCEDLFQDALAKVADKTAANIERFNGRFPYIGSGSRYVLTDNSTWVSGYWTGWLWQIYNLTGDLKFKEAAERHYDGYSRRFNTVDIHCHDVGVIYDMAAVRGFTVTGDTRWRNLGLRAAAFLSTRFKERGNYLQAWGMPYSKEPEFNRTIIDSLCCIPLWFWAAKVLDDDYYERLGREQADTVMKYLVRSDWSSMHTFYFDPDSGTPLRSETAQGASNDSTWSRGQGWGIQGFPICCAFTGDTKYLDAAVKMLDWYLDALGGDIVPPWDFSRVNEEKDTSAMTLAVNGMLRIAHLPETDGDIREACLLMAKKSMVKLIRDYASLDDRNAWGLVREGVYAKPRMDGVNEYMIWGDYYFVENLMILAGKNYLDQEIWNKK